MLSLRYSSGSVFVSLEETVHVHKWLITLLSTQLNVEIHMTDKPASINSVFWRYHVKDYVICIGLPEETGFWNNLRRGFHIHAISDSDIENVKNDHC